MPGPDPIPIDWQYNSVWPRTIPYRAQTNMARKVGREWEPQRGKERKVRGGREGDGDASSGRRGPRMTRGEGALNRPIQEKKREMEGRGRESKRTGTSMVAAKWPQRPKSSSLPFVDQNKSNYPCFNCKFMNFICLFFYRLRVKSGCWLHLSEVRKKFADFTMG